LAFGRNAASIGLANTPWPRAAFDGIASRMHQELRAFLAFSEAITVLWVVDKRILINLS